MGKENKVAEKKTNQLGIYAAVNLHEELFVKKFSRLPKEHMDQRTVEEILEFCWHHEQKMVQETALNFTQQLLVCL